MKDLDLELLFQLLGGHLHQDFMDDHDSVEKALDSMMAREPPESHAEAARELTALLALPLNEKQLAEILHLKLACYYYPPADGLTCRQWLSHVLVRLQGRAES